ncbi:glycosyltransferase [Nocardiopsis ansamitocini]|uniref:Erythromycin biosynthesis protein CIII-like C-terminal domain-containing protein n=1 Tax=Nocardiopsis ansamitocini TaxID=1670832 RepID=A0A9W6UGX1_9ACTN|nr:glycosyltransferase [Nocardiopsis ansamitocini]GLU45949.1 hypothetical protein Nans01_03000 [Nocardiopsis ansamitocini]
MSHNSDVPRANRFPTAAHTTPSTLRETAPHVVVVAPPSRSHARPLATIGSALRWAGARVTFACAGEFAPLAEQAGLDFYALRTSDDSTVAGGPGPREFLDATRRGAVPVLLAQIRHRRLRALDRPDEVRESLATAAAGLRPDWFLVNQLSYATTLALHCLDLPFASFCPGHPGAIPGHGTYSGVPYAWPRALRPADAELGVLGEAAARTDDDFTAEFNRIIAAAAPERPRVPRAFALTSPRARLFDYPPLPGLPTPMGDPAAVFAGHCTEAEELSLAWQARLGELGEGPLVLVSFGALLSAREDVLRAVVGGVRAAVPDAAVVVAAGGRAEALAGLAGPRVLVEPVIPRQTLLERADLFVHHGAPYFFAEALHAGVPALVLPFAGDQFAIAHDTELAEAGYCLDPNRSTARDIGSAAAALLRAPAGGLTRLGALLAERGPRWAALRLLERMGPASVASSEAGP